MPSFDTESNEIWPNPNTTILNLTNFAKELLQNSLQREHFPPRQVDIQDFIRKSNEFPIEFGTNTCRVMSQPKHRYVIIADQIATAYPVIHERVLNLYLNFLEHKCKYGNPIELKVYKNLSLTDFVQRLLAKRCVCFFGHVDFYKLLNGKTGIGGFQAVGSSEEETPLTLENVLSYDEIKLSALLSVSTHTEFLNDGNRKNSGCIEQDKSKIVEQGVIIGLIGPRFVVPDVMDCQDILITKSQNIKENGYGEKNKLKESRESDYRRLWREFYEEEDFLYKSVSADKTLRFFMHRRTGHTNEIVYFDNNVIKKRYAISFDTLLLETEARAAAVGRQAYLHVVGIGLGVWKAVKHQEELFLDTFLQRLKILLPKLKHLSVVHFSWFQVSEWKELKNDGFLRYNEHPSGGIKILISKRNPAEKLPNEFSEMLLVASFAWDGNSLPGNEFWEKCLSNSSDSATACCSLITELMNPHINTEAVNGANLHIATQNYGVLHIQDYCKNVLKISNKK